MAMIPIGRNIYLNTLNSTILSLRANKYIKQSDPILLESADDSLYIKEIFDFESVNPEFDKALLHRVYNIFAQHYTDTGSISFDRELSEFIGGVEDNIHIYECWMKQKQYTMFRFHNADSSRYKRYFVASEKHDELIECLKSIYEKLYPSDTFVIDADDEMNFRKIETSRNIKYILDSLEKGLTFRFSRAR